MNLLLLFAEETNECPLPNMLLLGLCFGNPEIALPEFPPPPPPASEPLLFKSLNPLTLCKFPPSTVFLLEGELLIFALKGSVESPGYELGGNDLAKDGIS